MEVSDTKAAPERAQTNPTRPAPDQTSGRAHLTVVREGSRNPFPTGWYAPAFSDELRPGQILTRPFLGRDVVLYRTESGIACAVEPFCPHLGAHMGHSGRVVGEDLRCDFHGFCFDREGRCTSTPTGGRLPKGRLRTLPLRELHGIVLVHHDETGALPTWEVPPIANRRMTALRHNTLTLHAHPQDTTENSVDVGHFSEVHRYRDVRVVKPLQLEGPYLTSRYGMRRPSGGVLGLFAQHPVEFEVHVHGLGYSRVEIEVAAIGLRAHQWVLATPSTPGELTLRLATAIDLDAPLRVPLLGWLPIELIRRLLNPILIRAVHGGVLHDVEQDRQIWRHKTHLERPMLAEGDGPIGPYRRWARQFDAVLEPTALEAP